MTAPAPPYVLAQAGAMAQTPGAAGWPKEAMASALAQAAGNGCRIDAVRIRGRLRDVFLARDGDGMVYVHVVVQPYPRRPTRLHALMRVGKGESGEHAARDLMRYLRAHHEAELRGADLRVRGMRDWHDTNDFDLLHPWLAGVWPAPQQPTAPTSAATTEPPAASAARVAA